MSIRILVADDHKLVRVGLHSLLCGTDITIVGEASSSEEAIRLVESKEADLLLLDVRMADDVKDGLWALGKLKFDRPELPVLMWSAFDSPALVARAVALGAHGYILKSATKDELVQAIRTAAAGQTTWKREELRRVANALSTPRSSSDCEVPLTMRETEVIKHMAEGLTNKEIARELGIGVETVKDHVHNMFRKLGVSDRTQAALWAVRRKLV